jgi:peptidoglycan hydrolase-like protein with peptidoglycan-binding domain
MKTGMTYLMAGLLGLFLIGGEASAQSLRDVATAAARVDRTDADAVREVQTGLRDLGFYSGPIDGVFGPMTYAAAVAAVEAVNAEVAAIQEARAQSMAAALANDNDGPSDGDQGGFGLAGAGGVSGPEFGGAVPSPVSGDSGGSMASVSVGSGGETATASDGLGAAAGVGEVGSAVGADD